MKNEKLSIAVLGKIKKGQLARFLRKGVTVTVEELTITQTILQLARPAQRKPGQRKKARRVLPRS